VVRRRGGYDPDDILAARVAGTAARHARAGNRLSPEQEAEAVAELRQLAGDRPDLLARCAGLNVGSAKFHPWDIRALAIADLCIQAGADASMITEWTTVGYARQQQSAGRPYTGTMHNRSSGS
jgi:hypothetical protein